MVEVMIPGHKSNEDTTSRWWETQHVLQKLPLGEMIQLDHFVETGLKPQPK